ncbi:MAG: S41 family peptidase [Planctomycetota bacterium]
MSCFTSVALLLALCTSLGTPVQDSGVAEQVDAKVSLLEKGGHEAIWEITAELVDLGENALPRLKEHASDPSPDVRLAVCRALLELEEIDTPAESLTELVRRLDEGPASDAKKASRRQAIELLGRRELVNHAGVVKFLSQRLETTLDPLEKIAVARSLYNVSPKDTLEAKNRLRETLRSDDRSIQVAGALALASIDDFEKALPILSEIERDPTPEGQLARVYVQKNRYYRENRNLRQQLFGESRQAFPNQEGDTGVLEEVIEKIQELHIRGEEFRGPAGREKLIAAAARGMLNFLDNHSTYFTSHDNERWNLDLQREYGGIGAYVETLDNVFTITRPIYPGPASKVGLQSGDQIWKVDGWETFDKPTEEIIRRLKGPPGSTVTVTVFRRGFKQERDYLITRELISVPSVNWEMFPAAVGYVEIVQFARDTADELARAAEELESRGLKSLVLDLRNNTGGYLETAVDVVGQFVGPGKLVVYTEGRVGDPEVWQTRFDSPRRPDYPVTVLVNRRSASASEIVAGALQHYNRAKLVGERTFGKGSVQNPVEVKSRRPEPFTDTNGDGRWDPGEDYEDLNHNEKREMGALIKITTARYFLPNKKSIHTERDEEGRVIEPGGVEPDLKVSFEGPKPWKEEELADLVSRDVFKDYVDKHIEGNETLFRDLAENDGRDPARYPEFDAFYTSLNTHLDRDDIRTWIRVFVRLKVSDLRQKAFPGYYRSGDWQEDSQLQAAIVESLKARGEDPSSVPDYAAFARREFSAPPEKAAGPQAARD